MKTRFIWIILMSIIFWGVSLAKNLPTPNNTPAQSVNGIAAIVNSDIITHQQLNQAISSARQQLQQNDIPIPNAKKLKTEILRQLIYQHLQLQIAKHNNIKASDKEVDEAMTHIAAQNHLSVAQLKQKLVQQGLSYKIFRKQLRKQLIITKLQHEAIADTIHVNQSEIAAFRRQHATQTNPIEYHVKHILIALPDSPTPAQIKQAKIKAVAILKQLRGRKSFDSLANAYPNSGDLGWHTLNDLPTLFANAVAKMKIGAVSEPLQAANGFHLLKLDGKRQKSSVTDQQIQVAIMQQKFGKALQKWLKQLWDSAYIHINKQ